MTDETDPDAPPPALMNRAQRRAAGKPQAAQGPAVNSRAGQIRSEREASARSAARSKPQLRK
ncbi:hypothetical protein [Phenylobacterium sp.]|uniref:hypothetical protein n=1 Tax=Phenylobacterium sp. TaxID=1871053 RepID=UPI003982DD74